MFIKIIIQRYVIVIYNNCISLSGLMKPLSNHTKHIQSKTHNLINNKTKLNASIFQLCYSRFVESGLTRLQTNIICRDNIDLIKTIYMAADRAYTECKKEFEYERWNCEIHPNIYPNNLSIIINFLKSGTKGFMN